jgi:hypothetical protein
MAGAIATVPKYQFNSSAGVPLVGGTLETYLAGTTTPVATYSDSALSSSNGTSITLDSRGEATLWLDDTKTYKFVLKDALGVTQWTVDNISGSLNLASLGFGGATLSGYINAHTCADYTALRAYTGTSKTAYVSGYSASVAPSGIAGMFVLDASDTTSSDNGGTIIIDGSSRRWKRVISGGQIDVRWFGAKVDGSTDDTSAIQAAIDYAASMDESLPVFLPNGVCRVTGQLTMKRDYLKLVGCGGGYSDQNIADYTGGSAILYDGSALSSPEGVIELGDSGTTDQARGIALEGFAVFCQELGIGVHGYSQNLATIKDVFVHKPTTGFYFDGSSYSTSIEDCTVLGATVGCIDLTTNCHSFDIIRCAFRGYSAGSEEPDFGIRVASVGNCSDVNVIGCSFDQYRIAQHFRVDNQCRSGLFAGNYVEARDDTITAGCLLFVAGDGWAITGNRITAPGGASTPITYGVEIRSPAHGFTVTGNWFGGFSTACIRVASGAANVFAAGNQCNSVTEVNDQNTSRSSVVVNSGNITAANLLSSTYTPTLTNTTNVAASTAYVTNYCRVGNMVTVAGRLEIDPTATGATELGISLPITSDLADPHDASGTAAEGSSGQVGRIYADQTNNRLVLAFNATDTANRNWAFHASYRVI